jgi:hypothetical protein
MAIASKPEGCEVDSLPDFLPRFAFFSEIMNLLWGFGLCWPLFKAVSRLLCPIQHFCGAAFFDKKPRMLQFFWMRLSCTAFAANTALRPDEAPQIGYDSDPQSPIE